MHGRLRALLYNSKYIVLDLVVQARYAHLHSLVCTLVSRINHQLIFKYLLFGHMWCCSIYKNFQRVSPASRFVIRSATLQFVLIYVVLHYSCSHTSITIWKYMVFEFFFKVDYGALVLHIPD